MTVLRRKLLAWYRTHHRKLPWRATHDPYRIWVSEVMLQQTRVATVIPYFKRFLASYPTVRKLAASDEDPVLRTWEGLGYYSRARNLHAAAREVVEKYGGNLPSSSAELASLPGFGPYISAAVASIAFGESTAVVDGNVRRVLSRLFETASAVDDRAQELIDPKHPGDFNQAVMELGALVCLPRSPKCEICPLSTDCLARKHGTIAAFPPARAKTKVRIVHAVTVIVQNRNRYFVTQRPMNGRWARMWEAPTHESARVTRLELVMNLLMNAYGLRLKRFERIARIEHRLSHQTIHTEVMCAEGRDHSKNGTWVTLTELSELSMSRLQREAFRRAVSPSSDRRL
ncbi:MAG: A/G-specific adenine glycosylase [Pseudomonadota bacterium]